MDFVNHKNVAIECCLFNALLLRIKTNMTLYIEDEESFPIGLFKLHTNCVSYIYSN